MPNTLALSTVSLCHRVTVSPITHHPVCLQYVLYVLYCTTIDSYSTRYTTSVFRTVRLNEVHGDDWSWQIKSWQEPSDGSLQNDLWCQEDTATEECPPECAPVWTSQNSSAEV